VKAWAICDTDGGRHEPKPLLRYIYDSEHRAKQAAEYHDFDPQWYPVLPISVIPEKADKQ